MSRLLLVVALVCVLGASAMAATYMEAFGYADGALIGNDNWTGPEGIPITVDAGRAKLTYNDAFRGQSVQVNFDPIGGDLIYWCVKVWAGAGEAGNAFDIWANDAAGLNFARWYGGINNERPRIDGFGQVLGGVTLVPDEWNYLCVHIDTVNKMSTFFFNGANLGSLQYNLYQPAIGNAVSQVTMGFQNASTSKDNSYKYYDLLVVSNEGCVPEPSSLLALGGFALGALGLIKRRRA